MLQRLFLFVILAFSFCSCTRTGCCSWKINVPSCLTFDGRRPQVIEKHASCIIDYAPPVEANYPKLLDQEDLNEEKEDFFSPPNATPYLLSFGDVLEISVYGEEESLQENVMVAPDGNIYYSVLGGIKALGRSVKEVSEELREKLTSLYIHPAVTVVPKMTNDQNITILGRVQKPGSYPILGQMRIRDILGEAGGIYKETDNQDNQSINSTLYPLADLRSSFIVRNQKKLPVDFEKLIYSPDDSENIEVRPGDYIYIASSGIQEVFILGDVRQPRRLIYTTNLTLMGALASSSGWFSGGPFGAVIERVIILRGSLKCPCAFEVNVSNILSGSALDILLQPGDIIFVPNKTMRFGRALVRIAINSFIQSFLTAGSGYYGQIQWFN